MTKNNYILDTSVLVYDPLCFKTFHDSNVIIPITVLDELDKLKKQSGEAGKNARVCIKLLDELCTQGDVSQGIEIEHGINIKIDATNLDASKFGDALYGDNRILACANFYNAYNTAVLVSNDINLRVRARALGIGAKSCETKGISFSDLYAGFVSIKDEDLGEELLQRGWLDPSELTVPMLLNECVVFVDDQNEEVACGRKISSNKIKLIKRVYPWDIAARNSEQAFAMDLIMDKKISLVTLIGKAGTGKSLVTLASALELVTSKQYDKFIIYRPIQAVGNDIGFLPGTMEEKLAPWFEAIMDNFEILLNNSNGHNWIKDFEMFKKKGQIEMQALTYIRGRSIPNSIILVDECQNLSKEEVKTILTRAGEDTKIILTGDIEQIDNSDLDATNNGLTYVIDKFKDTDLAGHITFTRGERSRLATVASEIL